MKLYEMALLSATRMRGHVRKNDRGSAMVEYALLLALIAVICLLALNYLGESTNGTINNAASVVDAS